MISKVICKIKKHKLVEAGTCPFTGSTYQHCTRCGLMIPIQSAV
jgi:hypothetical protein